jgi:hypothetical protein
VRDPLLSSASSNADISRMRVTGSRYGRKAVVMAGIAAF